MGTKDTKLLERVLSKPRDLKYHELKKLLERFNYEEHSSGKTSGSRIRFYNKEKKLKISMHKLHGSNPLKEYQIEEVINHLKEGGFIS